MIIDNWLNMLSCVIESVMIFMLCETFLKKRDNTPKWVYIFGIAISAIMINVSNLFYYIDYLNIIIISVGFFAVSFIYQGRLGVRVIISVFCVGLMGISEVLVLFIMTIIYSSTVTEIINNHIYVLVGTLVSKMLAFYLIKLIKVKYEKTEHYADTMYWALFSFMFISAVSTIFLIFNLSYINDKVYMYNSTILCSMGLLLSTFFAIHLYEHLAKQSDTIRKQQQYEQALKLQLKHLDEILVTQNQIKKFKHDFSNYIIGLKSYVDSNDLSSAGEYLCKLDSLFSNRKHVIETGNVALDAILSTKKAIADTKNIKFTTKIQIPNNINIAPIDICVIFGNALDNAIEACERIKNNVSKEISLNMMFNGEAIFCKISNTCEIKDGKLPGTSKADKINHGYGLDNIKTTLDKYNADLIIEQTSNEFALSFVIFLER